MIKSLESISYDTLDELQETYKSSHPDICRLTDKYGPKAKFSRVMYPADHAPRFESRCYYIV